MDRLLSSVVAMQRALDVKGIESALIGALALAAWGEPRATNDVDLRVLLERDDAQRLLDALPEGCVPIGDAPLQWLYQNAMVFVRDAAGVRVDLLLADIGFDREVVARAQQMELLPDVVARVCTAEDLLIYKMISTREKDAIDVISILRRQRGHLDEDYIRRWLREFEEALDDSTLIATFDRLSRKHHRR